jgi:hypothetical protein
MNSLSSLQNSPLNGLRSNESGLAQSLRKMGETAGAMGKSLTKGSELIQQRVDNLSKATTQMASDFISQFAQKMFGDQAKGMTIEFDEMSLSAESSFTAMQQSSQSAQGSSQASAFRLSDTSSFSGKGTLTTADGQRFEIEIEIRYESVIEGVSIAQQRNMSNGFNAIPNNQQQGQSIASAPIDALDLNQASDASAKVPVSSRKDDDKKVDGFKQDFAGTAMDLLQRLSSEPVFRPFGMFKPDADGKNGLQLLGEMSLQLLNLPGGPRYLDMSPDHNPDKKVLDAKA